MDELVAWLGQQFDEDARIARAAAARRGGGEWRAVPDADGITAVVGRHQSHDPDFPNVPVIMQGGTFETVEHAARHDPARVLREIDAKRQILAAYEQALRDAEFPDHLVRSPARVTVRVLEPVIRHLAAVYADRPGYREEWRP